MKKSNWRRGIHGYSNCVVALLLLALSFAQSTSAQIITNNWTITDPDLRGLHWGPQEIVVSVRNTSDNYKFLVAKSETRSPLRRYSDIRTLQSNYIFVPDEEKDVSFIVDVPENLSYVTVEIGFHDVVDTLDDVSWGKKIYQHTFTITPSTPTGLTEYANLAPRAGSVLKFNSALKTDLSLLLHTMLHKPLWIDSIARRLDLPFAVVARTIRKLQAPGLVQKGEDGLYQTTLTAIEGLSAKSVRALIDDYTSKMAEALKVSLPNFIKKRQQMMDAGLVTQGRRETLEGTAMLHHLYPVVGGITLWENVGSQFLIGGDGPPQMIDLDAPCDMVSAGYGYILIDSGLSDGDEFFYYDPPSKRRVFGDHVPGVICTRRTTTASIKANYFLPSKKTTLMYYYDKDRVAGAVNLLSDPLLPIRNSFSVEVKSLFEQSAVKLLPAHKFWLWNSLVTSIMQKLVNDGALEDRRREFFTWRERVTSE